MYFIQSFKYFIKFIKGLRKILMSVFCPQKGDNLLQVDN
jgi:hypothetical protein